MNGTDCPRRLQFLEELNKRSLLISQNTKYKIPRGHLVSSYEAMNSP